MSRSVMEILSENVGRAVGEQGVYRSNAAAAAASGGSVSRSTFHRLRNQHKPGASAVGIDKIDGVAKVLGVQAWQLFVPGLDVRRPPVLAHGQTAWPFEGLDPSKVANLSDIDRGRLEAAMLLTAAQFGLDVKRGDEAAG